MGAREDVQATLPQRALLFHPLAMGQDSYLHHIYQNQKGRSGARKPSLPCPQGRIKKDQVSLGQNIDHLGKPEWRIEEGARRDAHCRLIKSLQKADFPALPQA
jgi:hypothetical protein